MRNDTRRYRVFESPSNRSAPCLAWDPDQQSPADGFRARTPHAALRTPADSSPLVAPQGHFLRVRVAWTPPSRPTGTATAMPPRQSRVLPEDSTASKFVLSSNPDSERNNRVSWTSSVMSAQSSAASLSDVAEDALRSSLAEPSGIRHNSARCRASQAAQSFKRHNSLLHRWGTTLAKANKQEGHMMLKARLATLAQKKRRVLMLASATCVVSLILLCVHMEVRLFEAIDANQLDDMADIEAYLARPNVVGAGAGGAGEVLCGGE